MKRFIDRSVEAYFFGPQCSLVMGGHGTRRTVIAFRQSGVVYLFVVCLP